MRPEKKSFSAREIRQQFLEALSPEEPETPIGEPLEYDAYDASIYDFMYDQDEFDYRYGFIHSYEQLQEEFEMTDNDWDDAFDWEA